MKPNRDFKQFQSEFAKYQQRFGLNGYKVYFKHEPLKDSFASLSTTTSSMVATATLNSETKPEDRPFKHPRISGKHEAIHLLLNRLEYLARSRYLNSDELDEAVEELTVKLEGLIP